MDPTSTSPDGARALVTLLRDHGVEVIEAGDVPRWSARRDPTHCIVMVQTAFLDDDDLLRRLADLPGDRLLVAPTSRTREALAPEIRPAGAYHFGGASPTATCGRPTRAGRCSSAWRRLRGPATCP